MEALMKLLIVRKCHPVILFWEAINYYERRMAQEALGKLFMVYCEKLEDGSINLLGVPDWVENYCLDVLASRATPMEMKYD
jgi:hypothetical protein